MTKASACVSRPRRFEWSDEEEVEFRALFSVAWALRETDALRAALETIEEWHADLPWRRAQAHVAHAAVAAAERETDPDRILGRSEAT